MAAFFAAFVLCVGLACGGPGGEVPPPEEPGVEEPAPTPSLCESNPCQVPGRTVCVGDAERYFCLCDEGLVLDGEACVPHREPACGFEHAGDAFEPDDCVDQALWVPPEGISNQARTFGDGEGDVDWLRFDAQEGDSWRVDLRSGGALAVAIEVLTAEATPLFSRQFAGDATWAFRAPYTGTYFLRLRSPILSAKGPYLLTVKNDGVDLHPPSLETEEVVTVEAPGIGRIQFSGDEDAVWLTLPAKRRWQATLAWEDGQKVPLQLRAFDEQGRLLSQANGLPAKLQLFSQEEKQVLLVARDAAMRATGAWRISLEDLGEDDHGDTRETATVTSGVRASGQGRFEHGQDLDVFLFTPEPGGIYRFRCDAVDVPLACAARVFDPQGNEVPQPASGAAELLVKPTEPGAWLIRLSQKIRVDRYDWSFERIGFDDHGDTDADATLLSIPAVSVAGSLQTPTDRDVFVVHGRPNQLLRVTCRTLQGASCAVILSDAGGKALALLSGTTDRFSVRDHARFHLEVSAGSAEPFGYLLDVVDLGPDDHGNTGASATRLDATSMGTGKFDGLFDADWFVSKATSGARVRVECTAALPCSIKLWDEAGQMVAAGTGALNFQAPSAMLLFVELTTDPRELDVAYQWSFKSSGP